MVRRSYARFRAMSLRIVYYVLWIAPVAVFLCLAAMMLRRKLHKEYPLFFAFVVLQVADFAIGFSAYHISQRDYFYAYWTLAGLGIGISFGVLYEVFTGVFRPFADLREFGGVLFRWAALVLLLAAVLLMTTARPPANTAVFALILNLMRSLEVMQCGLVLLMLLCSSYLGITLRHRIFGIALGFGIIAAVDLISGRCVRQPWLAGTDFLSIDQDAGLQPVRAVVDGLRPCRRSGAPAGETAHLRGTLELRARHGLASGERRGFAAANRGHRGTCVEAGERSLQEPERSCARRRSVEIRTTEEEAATRAHQLAVGFCERRRARWTRAGTAAAKPIGFARVDSTPLRRTPGTAPGDREPPRGGS